MQGLPRPTQSFQDSFHSNHNHRNRNALANFSVLSTLRPPYSFDLQTAFQLTLHLACVVFFAQSSLKLVEAIQSARGHDERCDREHLSSCHLARWITSTRLRGLSFGRVWKRPREPNVRSTGMRFADQRSTVALECSIPKSSQGPCGYDGYGLNVRSPENFGLALATPAP